VGNLYSDVQLYDLVVRDDEIEVGEPRAQVRCFLDSGTTRTVVSDAVTRLAKTIRLPVTASYKSGTYPVHLIAMRLVRPGCKPRVMDVAVSANVIASADVDEALVILGQDHLQRDRVSMRFDERLDLHGLHCGGPLPATRHRITARTHTR
jgi:hypothetical protein